MARYVFDVFISHSSKDKAIADALKHKLEASSVRAWKAPDNILPGQVWEEAITEAISICKITLLIWSSESQDSQQVKRELALAASMNKIIIPFRIQDLKPEGTFAYYLTNTHWLDAFSIDQVDAILVAVDRIAKILPFATPESGKETKKALHGSITLEKLEVQNPLIRSSSASPYSIPENTDSIIARIISKRLKDINLLANSLENSGLDLGIGNPKTCNAAALSAFIPLSMRDSQAASIVFTADALVVTIDDQASILLPRDGLYASTERDQRIRINALSLITSKLSKDHLTNLGECINMWSTRFKSLSECELHVGGELLRAYWNSDANSCYYPEVTNMTEVLCDEEYGIEHFRKEPEDLGLPIAEFYLKHLGQSLYLYKDWIELYFSRSDPMLQFCFIPLGELNDFVTSINSNEASAGRNKWNYFASRINPSLAGVLKFWTSISQVTGRINH